MQRIYIAFDVLSITSLGDVNKVLSQRKINSANFGDLPVSLKELTHANVRLEVFSNYLNDLEKMLRRFLVFLNSQK